MWSESKLKRTGSRAKQYIPYCTCTLLIHTNLLWHFDNTHDIINYDI